MPSIGTSRGYGNEPDDQIENTSDVSYEMHDEEEHAEGHGHHAPPPDPSWVKPTASTFDDLYITAGDHIVDPTPVGALKPSQILDNMIAPPLAYAIDWGRIITAGLWATLVFTPIWYFLYFGYKDSCFDLGLILGSMVSPALDWTTRLIGLGIHFGIGIAFAATYAYTLLVLRTQSSAGRGTQFGIGLCFAMTTFGLSMYVATIARLIPWSPTFDMPDMLLQQAGPANLGYGPFVVAFIAHMFYGSIVGGIYRHKVVLRQSDTIPLAA